MHKQRPSFSRCYRIPGWKETSVKSSMGSCFENKQLLLNLYYDHSTCHLNSSSSKLVSAFPVGHPLPLHHPCLPASRNTIRLLVNSVDSGVAGGKSVTQR